MPTHQTPPARDRENTETLLPDLDAPDARDAGEVTGGTFRLTNLRANANGLGASQTLIPTQIS